MGLHDGQVAALTDPSIQAAVRTIRQQWSLTPRVAVILGTGHGALQLVINAEAEFAYRTLPGFAETTAPGHEGRLLCGSIAGVSSIVLAGRFHAYEGHSKSELTRPVRLAAALGVDVLIATNASGGLNPSFHIGDIMVVDDHIDLISGRVLATGASRAMPTERSASMDLYDAKLIDQALEVSRQENFAAHRGVYVAVPGPNFETRAEYRFLRRIGADAVGMSTAPEALAARAAGLRVLAISTITNVCSPDVIRRTASDDVLAAAESATVKLQSIVRGVVHRLGE